MSDDEIKSKVQAAAATLELTEHLDRKPANLSGGQRQRVAMGRAIVRDAEAFLFDEPLSNLDAKLRGQMRTEILRMQRRMGTTTVYVTHDQTEAMTLGDRVAVLRKGVLQQVATPRELYEHPVNMFVAGFIGSPPMNFVPGTLEGGTLNLPFVSIELPADMRAVVGDRDHLMVGIRPEAFEDVALLDATKRERGVRSRRPSTSSSGWATSSTPTSPTRRPTHGRWPPGARARARQRAHAQPAGRRPRPDEPHQRQQRCGAVVGPTPDALFDPPAATTSR